jgi:hypothetical protein
MKARVKATGEIVEVIAIDGDWLFCSDGAHYGVESLEGIESEIDYWTRLEHQYAGMAMQGILSNPESELDYKGDETLPQALAGCAAKVAHALIQKLKEKEERK